MAEGPPRSSAESLRHLQKATETDLIYSRYAGANRGAPSASLREKKTADHLCPRLHWSVHLISAGSSMDKVLKVNVYLNDIKDWPRMNTAYAGRWGQDSIGPHDRRARRWYSRRLAHRI